MTFDWSRVGETPAPMDALAGMPVAELLPDEDGTDTAVQARNPYSMEPIRKKLAPYETQLVQMLKAAEATTVVDDKTAEAATALGVQCRKVEKAVEEARTYFKRPALDFSKEIDSLAKAYTSKAQSAANILSGKVAAYVSKKRAEEAERLRKEREEAAKLQAKLDAEAKAAKADAAQVVMPKAAPKTAPVRAENGKASVVTKWVCTITDPALVPREYCEPVQRLLNEAVKLGIREIPGCTIEEQSSARFGA